MSGACGKQPLIPITAIGSSLDLVGSCVDTANVRRPCRRRPLTAITGSVAGSSAMASVGFGFPKTLANSSPCSRTKYSAKAPSVGASKNTVGLNSKP